MDVYFPKKVTIIFNFPHLLFSFYRARAFNRNIFMTKKCYFHFFLEMHSIELITIDCSIFRYKRISSNFNPFYSVFLNIMLSCGEQLSVIIARFSLVSAKWRSG